MGLSFHTYIDIFFCLLAFVFFRPPFTNTPMHENMRSNLAENKLPAALTIHKDYNTESPLSSATIPSITVSPAPGSARNDFPACKEPQPTEVDDDDYYVRTVTFAPCAMIVEDMEPEPSSTPSSETLPSPQIETNGRRGSDHIKISSVLAQGVENTKHTIKSRPLTPFVKFNGEEDPLTAQIGGEFDVKDMSSVVIGKSIEGGETLEAHAEIESVTFANEEDVIRKPLLSAKM